MTVVIADASPLRYLILVGEIEILQKLYGEVLVPESVISELSHPRTPEAVRWWALNLPGWVGVTAPARHADEASLAFLDIGERDAILVALAVAVPLLLMDDRDGVHEARRRGLAVTGTLGILDRAACSGLIDIAQVIGRLRETNFRAAPALIELLLAQHADEPSE